MADATALLKFQKKQLHGQVPSMPFFCLLLFPPLSNWSDDALSSLDPIFILSNRLRDDDDDVSDQNVSLSLSLSLS